jgi:Pyruvate/2-oxoacid:ferredoxin oxidoreductase gamma subunit
VSEAGDQTRSPEQIESDIEATRGQLADTVEALAEKTDVKAQAKAKATEAKANAQAKAQEAAETVKTDRTVQYALAGATAAIVLIVLLKRRS